MVLNQQQQIPLICISGTNPYLVGAEIVKLSLSLCIFEVQCDYTNSSIKQFLCQSLFSSSSALQLPTPSFSCYSALPLPNLPLIIPHCCFHSSATSLGWKLTWGKPYCSRLCSGSLLYRFNCEACSRIMATQSDKCNHTLSSVGMQLPLNEGIGSKKEIAGLYFFLEMHVKFSTVSNNL